MPDPQHTREWAPQEGGGPEEIARQEAGILHQSAVATREYAPSEEGGPDELARGGEGFVASVITKREEQEAINAPVDEESLKADLLADMPSEPIIVKEKTASIKGKENKA
jgi:hypothetical protein